PGGGSSSPLSSLAVSKTSVQGEASAIPGGGSTNGIVLAWSALNNSSMVSPTIASPCSSTSISPPYSCTPRHRTNDVVQASFDISSPVGSNQAISGASAP